MCTKIVLFSIRNNPNSLVTLAFPLNSSVGQITATIVFTGTKLKFCVEGSED